LTIFFVNPEQPNPHPVTPTNPHVLWRQVLGFLFWGLLISLPAGGPLGAALFLTLGALTFADAWKSGIYKRPNSSSFVNISPMGWGVTMALFSIAAYPAYLISRNKLRTIHAGNGFFIAVIIWGALLIGWALLSTVIALNN
jgi:hypothetical protein